MRNSTLISCFAILFVVFVQCKKPQDRKCFKSLGQSTTVMLNSSNYLVPNVRLEDNISIRLINDSLNYIALIGAENLLNLIHFEVDADTLKVSDGNKCASLRNHKDAFVLEYHYTHLKSLTLLGYGAVTNADMLKHDVMIVANNSFSTINLVVDNQNTYISVPLGNVPVTLSGKTDDLFVYSAGHSPVRAENLFAINAHGNSRGVADFHLRASQFINVELHLKGDFYVYGNPIQKKYSVDGIGQIFEVED